MIRHNDIGAEWSWAVHRERGFPIVCMKTWELHMSDELLLYNER